MKRLVLPLLLLSISIAAVGQTDKEERKKWKQLAKEYRKDPMRLKTDMQKYKTQIEDLTSQLDELEEDLDQCNTEQANLQKSLRQTEGEVQELRDQLADVNINQNGQDTVNVLPTDLRFYVQIGAYRKFNINHYFSGARCMDVTVDDNLNKYIVGSFKKPEDAEQFRGDIQKMGIADAWVVPYFGGKRIPMEDAKQLMENVSMLIR